MSDTIFADIANKYSVKNKYKVENETDLSHIILAAYLFAKQHNINIIDLNMLDISAVESLDSVLFTGETIQEDAIKKGIKLDIRQWDTSNVSILNNAFCNGHKILYNFEDTIQKLDFSNVVSAKAAFREAHFNKPIKLKFPLLNTADLLFINTVINKPLDIDLPNVRSMYATFYSSDIKADIHIKAPKNLLAYSTFLGATVNKNIDFKADNTYYYLGAFSFHRTSNFDSLYNAKDMLLDNSTLKEVNIARRKIYSKLKSIFKNNKSLQVANFEEIWQNVKLNDVGFKPDLSDLSKLKLISYFDYNTKVIDLLDYNDVTKKDISNIAASIGVESEEDYKSFINFKDIVNGKAVSFPDVKNISFDLAEYKHSRYGALEINNFISTVGLTSSMIKQLCEEDI